MEDRLMDVEPWDHQVYEGQLARLVADDMVWALSCYMYILMYHDLSFIVLYVHVPDKPQVVGGQTW